MFSASSSSSPSPPSPAALILEDGSVQRGYGIGSLGGAVGELCFNTTMSGYQEVLSDPSYAEQIIVFTFPHIGTVGVNEEDEESEQARARACVFANKPEPVSNWRARGSVESWLAKQGMIGIYGIDTRALVRRIRESGALRAAVLHQLKGPLPVKHWKRKVVAWPGLEGAELAYGASCRAQYEWSKTLWNPPSAPSPAIPASPSPAQAPAQGAPHIVAVDFGIKHSILRHLVALGMRVTVVPAHTTSESILELAADGIFLSNGPGDPAASARYSNKTLQHLLSTRIPIFGICLGFQLLALALGARTEKMLFGHHGANHPVQDLSSGRVEITSQNHGFSVARESLPSNVEATHVSLFDGGLEGFSVKDAPVFAVQYHPEASPGPHDAHYLFERFIEAVRVYSTARNKPSQ